MIEAEVDRFSRFADSHGLPLDARGVERVLEFLRILGSWNDKTRLTGDRSTEILLLKHCADSLVVASETPQAASVVDIGSGAGFPGLVMACLRPDLTCTLVDSKSKACSFLDVAVTRLSLSNVRVVNARAEDLPVSSEESRFRFDVGVSRGVRLSAILPTFRGLLRPCGTLIAMLAKGQAAPVEELQRAGFGELRRRSYHLPTGEIRNLELYRAA